MQKSQRLIQMIMLINARKSFTVNELANEFGLSSRTITRDLQELSELGVPLYSVQGRGGGYKLLQERLLPPEDKSHFRLYEKAEVIFLPF